MAKIFCNFNELDPTELSGVDTYGDLILYLSGSVVPSGEVVYRVVVDGEDIDENEEMRMGKSPLEAMEIVEIYTRNALDIAVEGLKSATELVPSIRADVLRSSEEIRGGNFEDGYGLVGDLSPYLGWYIDLLDSIERVFILPGNEFILSGANGKGKIASFELIESMREQLFLLARAQEHGDHAAVADILEYEIAPIIETWEREVTLLMSRLSASKASA